SRARHLKFSSRPPTNLVPPLRARALGTLLSILTAHSPLWAPAHRPAKDIMRRSFSESWQRPDASEQKWPFQRICCIPDTAANLLVSLRPAAWLVHGAGEGQGGRAVWRHIAGTARIGIGMALVELLIASRRENAGAPCLVTSKRRQTGWSASIEGQ